MITMFENLIRFVAFAVLLSQQALYGIILGVVQGVSEWLPISSKTQIIIVATYLLKLTFNQAYAFGLFMEIGTIFAAIIYFRREVLSMINALLGKGTSDGVFLLKYVVVSTIFTGIVGGILYLYVNSLKGSYNLGLPMIVLGAVLLCDALFIRYSRSKYNKNTNRRTVSQLGFKDYVVVGALQGVAALPGVSRSGVTTSALLLLNVETDEAFRLSFIDMILATSGAIALTLVASRSAIASSIALIGAYGLLISIAVATVISLLLINFLLNIAKKSSIIYLISALGVIAILGGILTALYGVA
jgi:undecaprenyl-diphosphatase